METKIGKLYWDDNEKSITYKTNVKPIIQWGVLKIMSSFYLEKIMIEQNENKLGFKIYATRRPCCTME